MIIDSLTDKFSHMTKRFEMRQPFHYYTSQWQVSEDVPRWYLAYRWVFALFFIVVMVVSIARLEPDDTDIGLSMWKWPIFLTNWGFTLCTCVALMSAYFVTRASTEGLENIIDDEVTWPHVIYESLHSVATTFAICITCLYWLLVFNPELHKVGFINVSEHALNSVTMLVDLFIVNHIVSWKSIVFSLVLGFVYLMFTLIYFLLGGTAKMNQPYIYPILDWREPFKVIILMVIVVILLVLVHLLTYMLFLLRRYLARKFYPVNTLHVTITRRVNHRQGVDNIAMA